MVITQAVVSWGCESWRLLALALDALRKRHLPHLPASIPKCCPLPFISDYLSWHRFALGSKVPKSTARPLYMSERIQLTFFIIFPSKISKLLFDCRAVTELLLVASILWAPIWESIWSSCYRLLYGCDVVKCERSGSGSLAYTWESSRLSQNLITTRHLNFGKYMREKTLLASAMRTKLKSQS